VRPDYCLKKMIARLFRREAEKPVGGATVSETLQAIGELL
jgi:hypothetical protein